MLVFHYSKPNTFNTRNAEKRQEKKATNVVIWKQIYISFLFWGAGSATRIEMLLELFLSSQNDMMHVAECVRVTHQMEAIASGFPVWRSIAIPTPLPYSLNTPLKNTALD